MYNNIHISSIFFPIDSQIAKRTNNLVCALIPCDLRPSALLRESSFHAITTYPGKGADSYSSQPTAHKPHADPTLEHAYSLQLLSWRCETNMMCDVWMPGCLQLNLTNTRTVQYNRSFPTETLRLWC